jgi:hypothetical protein
LGAGRKKSLKKICASKSWKLKKLAHNALDSVTVEDWKRCVAHCDLLQDDDYVKEGLCDEILESIIVTVNSDESSESENEGDY